MDKKIMIIIMFIVISTLVMADNSTNITNTTDTNVSVEINITEPNVTIEPNETIEPNITINTTTVVNITETNVTVEAEVDDEPEEEEEEAEPEIQIIRETIIIKEVLANTTPAIEPKKEEEPTKNLTINIQSPEEEEKTDWEMVGAIIGLLAIIGALVGWYISKIRRSKSSKYLKEINETFDAFRSDTSRCEAKLYLLKERVEKDFTEGKIDESSLALLHTRIEKYLKNVRLGVVDSLDISPEAKKEIGKMLKDGSISDDEFSAFKNSKALTQKDKDVLAGHLKKWKKKEK